MMSFKKLIISSAAVLLLAGCAHLPYPIVLVVPPNQVLKGNEYNGISDPDSFSATNGSLTCTGDSRLLRNDAVVTCNDGRKGVVFFTDHSGDHGQITFTDGSKADFFRGAATSAF